MTHRQIQREKEQTKVEEVLAAEELRHMDLIARKREAEVPLHAVWLHVCVSVWVGVGVWVCDVQSMCVCVCVYLCIKRRW